MDTKENKIFLVTLVPLGQRQQSCTTTYCNAKLMALIMLFLVPHNKASSGPLDVLGALLSIRGCNKWGACLKNKIFEVLLYQ